MYRLGMLLLIKVVRRSRRKVQFMSISCELGSMSKYSRFSLSMSSSGYLDLVQRLEFGVDNLQKNAVYQIE